MGFLRLNFTFNIFLFKKFVKWESSSFVQNLLSRKIRIDCVQNVAIKKIRIDCVQNVAIKKSGIDCVQNVVIQKSGIDCVQNVVIQKKKFLLIYKITLQINLIYVYICHIYAFGFVFISRIIW